MIPAGWEKLDGPSPERAAVKGGEVAAGSRVRLEPRVKGDALTAALAGKSAVVESVEQDLDDRIMLAVRLEDDPSRDLGRGRQIGHRFYVTPEEVVPLAGSGSATVLVAGVGDAFRGDAGFGCRVIEALSRRSLPSGAETADFGLRKMDLTHAFADGYDAVIVVEAVTGEGKPGTLSVAEAIGTVGPSRVVELRCSIAENAVSSDLSPPVAAALEDAVAKIEALVGDLVPSERTEGARVE